MSDEAWNAGYVKGLGMWLAGDRIGDVDELGESVLGDTVLLLLNAHHEAIAFSLPANSIQTQLHWLRTMDTAEPTANGDTLQGGQQYLVQGRSLALLRQK
jgi:isoamylase